MGCNTSQSTVDFESVCSQNEAIEYVKQKLDKCENILIIVQKLRKNLYSSINMDQMCQHFLGNLYDDIHDVHKEISFRYPEESVDKQFAMKTVKEQIRQLKELKSDFFDSLSDSNLLANSGFDIQDIVLELHWKQQTLYNYFLNNKRQATNNTLSRSISSTSTTLSF